MGAPKVWNLQQQDRGASLLLFANTVFLMRAQREGGAIPSLRPPRMETRDPSTHRFSPVIEKGGQGGIAARHLRTKHHGSADLFRMIQKPPGTELPTGILPGTCPSQVLRAKPLARAASSGFSRPQPEG